MKNSLFRQFCNDMWFRHKDEVLTWERKTVDYGSEYYFSKNKWMLKRLFVEQYAFDNAREIQKQIKRNMKRGNL